MAIRELNDWTQQARPDQIPPSGEWRTWYVRGARGSGKTRTGAETLANWIKNSPPGDWAIVAPTDGDARDTCLLGRSGLLKILGNNARYNKSKNHVELKRGGIIYLDGADDGAYRVQGKNLRGAWCDEVGLWHRMYAETAWDESIQFAVRLNPGKIVATGTPKRGNVLVGRLINDPDVVKTHLRLEDNEENLSAAAVAALRARFEGTTLGRQELYGEYLVDVENALWRRDVFLYLPKNTEEIPDGRLIVAVDPATTSNATSDETGIVVASAGSDGRGYILEDLSGIYSPDGWAKMALKAYHEWQADAIVAEVNNGGDMVANTIRTLEPNVPVRQVRASRGKAVRAEPVAALYEQNRIVHREPFIELEDQLCNFTGDARKHDDRVDAVVWAMTELMLGGVEGGGVIVLSTERRIAI